MTTPNEGVASGVCPFIARCRTSESPRDKITPEQPSSVRRLSGFRSHYYCDEAGLSTVTRRWTRRNPDSFDPDEYGGGERISNFEYNLSMRNTIHLKKKPVKCESDSRTEGSVQTFSSLRCCIPSSEREFRWHTPPSPSSINPILPSSDNLFPLKKTRLAATYHKRIYVRMTIVNDTHDTSDMTDCCVVWSSTMYHHLKPSAALVVLMVLASVAAQTFQYSRGWTNGKRDGRGRGLGARDDVGDLERALSPCQMIKIRYIIEGKPLNEKNALSRLSRPLISHRCRRLRPALGQRGLGSQLHLPHGAEILVPCDYNDDLESAPQGHLFETRKEPGATVRGPAMNAAREIDTCG
ncbi:Pro-corazonin [Eumeta japonica]|uniref:Pro-corazonin n=1 Tax=Eumeta variegata TaxID=151549 RepID=A0A4C1VIQ9_EUMVA|nr:Pro-corazonin [Eumeta japonica]